MSDTAPTTVDQKTFWRTLGERPIGITIVTDAGPTGPAGLLALSAAHVSADPPTLLVSIDRRTSALSTVLEAGAFAVNFLPAEAAHVADAFGGKSGLTGKDRFVPAEWGSLATGAPVFEAALGVFDCRIVDVVQRGDVSVVFGAVIACRAAGAGDPLVFFRGKTRALAGLG